uniref:Uncharacterized protein n=1 Tax=Panagrolaimus sp. ES5 TaxID=591445 RepID=A0AC34GVB8_9BILA
MNQFGNFVQVKPVAKEISKEEEDAQVRESFLAFIRNFFDVKNIEPENLKTKIMQMHIYIRKLATENYELEKHLELQRNCVLFNFGLV